MRIWLSLTCCVVLGCGRAEQGSLIPLEEVPEAMMRTAKEKLPEVEFEQAIKRADGSMEVRGKDKRGKVRDVEFGANGEFLEIE